MDAITQLIWQSVWLGSVYALIGVTFSLQYQSSKTLNFSHFSTIASGGLIGYSCMKAGWLASISAALFAGACLGIATYYIAIEPAVRRVSKVWIISTIAISLVLKSVFEWAFGREPLGVSPISETVYQVAGAAVQAHEIFVLIVCVAIIIGVDWFVQKSPKGKVFEAVANDPKTAELCGVNSKFIVAAAWAASCGLGAVAGCLISPITMASPEAGIGAGLLGFSAAAAAGFNSPRGAVLIAFLLAFSEALMSFYVSSGWKTAPALAGLILVLAIKPTGVFSKYSVKKV